MTPLHPGSSEDLVLTGACEISLERAILRYRPPTRVDGAEGQGEDLGLGVVLAASAGGGGLILDLGSGRVNSFSPDGPVVLLGWVLASAVDRIKGNLEEDPQAVRRMGFAMAMKVLDRTGFGALTRPLFLRLGFRDVVQDIDPHEGASVRVQVAGHGVVTLYMDPDSATVVVRAPWLDRSSTLEEALVSAFRPEGDSPVETELGSLSRSVDVSGRQTYRLDLPLPESVSESRLLLRRIRAGIMALVADFEPERHAAISERVEVFGSRDTLRQVREGGGARRFPVLPSTRLRSPVHPTAAGPIRPSDSRSGPDRIH